MSSAWLPIRTVNLMRAPPDSWLHTISIGRSPAYFSFNNRLCYIIAIPWEYQLKTVDYSTEFLVLMRSAMRRFRRYGRILLIIELLDIERMRPIPETTLDTLISRSNHLLPGIIERASLAEAMFLIRGGSL